MCSGNSFVQMVDGYWRPSESVYVTYPCHHPDACIGGNSTPTCGAGRAADGPLCNVCNEGYGLNGDYVCEECGAGAAVLLVVGIILFVLIVVVLVVATINRPMFAMQMPIALKILINQLQISGMLSYFLISDVTPHFLRTFFQVPPPPPPCRTRT